MKWRPSLPISDFRPVDDNKDIIVTIKKTLRTKMK